MYAVIQTGGKQYKVQPGDTVYLEKLPGAAGDPVEFNEVLLLADAEQVAIGQPLVEGAKVTGEIVEQGHPDDLLWHATDERARRFVKAIKRDWEWGASTATETSPWAPPAASAPATPDEARRG